MKESLLKNKLKKVHKLLNDVEIACFNHGYNYTECLKFISYWLEFNGRSFLFEKELTKKGSFDVGRRLGRWMHNSKKFNKVAVNADADDEFNKHDF